MPKLRGEVVPTEAHNLGAVGSTPTPATKKEERG